MPSQRGVRLSARECALLIALGLPVLLIHLCDYIADIGDSQLGSGNDSGCSWQRDLSLLELFSGSATLTATYRSHGARAQYYDWEARGAENDFLSTVGFLWALRDTMRLQRGALLWGGLPCCSWVWISSGTHLRYSCILGDS